MPSLDDFILDPAPAGWHILRRVNMAGTDLIFYAREHDLMYVSMSWEGKDDPPHMHMSFSKSSKKPTEEEALGAVRELLPGYTIARHQAFDQLSNLHKATMHVKVYLNKAAA